MRHTEWGDRHHSFGWLATEPRHLQPASDPADPRDEPADTSTIRDRARGPRPVPRARLTTAGSAPAPWTGSRVLESPC